MALFYTFFIRPIKPNTSKLPVVKKTKKVPLGYTRRTKIQKITILELRNFHREMASDIF